MDIYGLNKTTLLDYPGKVAATIFTGSCNFCCPFCHNKDLVLNPSSQPLLAEENIFSFFKKRIGILSGICITGGEPTLQKDLLDFCKKIKDLGYLLKLDTNGYQPAVIERLLAAKLLDYIAMDIKSSLSDYKSAAGIKNFESKNITDSISLIQNSDISYEFRTTVIKELHHHQTFLEIRELLQPGDTYFLQSYEENEHVISPGFHAHSKETLEEFVCLLREKTPSVFLRGIE